MLYETIRALYNLIRYIIYTCLIELLRECGPSPKYALKVDTHISTSNSDLLSGEALGCMLSDSLVQIVDVVKAL